MTFSSNQGKLTKRFLDTAESPQCKKKRKTALKTPTLDSLYQPSSELGKIKPISQKHFQGRFPRKEHSNKSLILVFSFLYKKFAI